MHRAVSTALLTQKGKAIPHGSTLTIQYTAATFSPISLQFKAMTEAAPGIIHLMDRMGVMFNRTAEGLLDFRRFGGTQYHRTAFAGATTGQQLLYALDEQVRRYEAAGLVNKYEGWEFLSAVLDDEGACRGVTVQNLSSHDVETFRGDAVIMATGGPGIMFGKSTK